MPKKLPFYWPDDPNCNKLRSRNLRVLRDRPNKLNSGPRPIQSLCDSYKTKHFKTEKSEKLRPIEDFHGFLSSETILSRHSKNRARVRQLLQSTKQRSDILQNLNLNSSWKKKYSNAMAVDFDHMYIDCGDSKLSISRDIEYQHLKQMNLLHLDLIQQQTDQIIAKDKIIKALKEENKNLRARLERIDRRVSLSHQKKNALSPISVQTDFADDISLSFSVKADSPKISGHKSPSAKSPTLRGVDKPSPLKCVREEILQNELSPSKKESLRSHSPKHITSISASSPTPQTLRASPREKRIKKETTSNATEFSLLNNTGIQTPVSSTPINLLSLDTANKKIRSPTSKRLSPEDPLIPPKKNKSVEPDVPETFSLSPIDGEGVTDHSLRSRNKSHDDTIQSEIPKTEKEEPQSPLAMIVSGSSQKWDDKQNSVISHNNLISVEPEKFKPSFKANLETRKIRGDGILTTTESYYLPPASNEFLETSVEDETQVELPKWRIKVLTSLYVMEGTENLEDEIFNKRHSKPEHDERRRKRWDLQRMREQRQYEKLRERYEGRNNPNGSCGRNQSSLWPNPDLAQILHIDDSLPVCAFGQPLAQIPESDFYVPWLTGKTPLQVSIATRRKKR